MNDELAGYFKDYPKPVDKKRFFSLIDAARANSNDDWAKSIVNLFVEPVVYNNGDRVEFPPTEYEVTFE